MQFWHLKATRVLLKIMLSISNYRLDFQQF